LTCDVYEICRWRDRYTDTLTAIMGVPSGQNNENAMLRTAVADQVVRAGWRRWVLGAVHPAVVQEAECPLGAGGEALPFPEAAVLVHSV